MGEKNKNKKFIIVGIILGLVIIIYSVLNNYIKIIGIIQEIKLEKELAEKQEELEKIKFQDGIEKYKIEVNNYLKGKYNEEFDIQILHTGYKTSYLLGTGCGHDESTKEFVYKVYPLNNEKIFFYVTVWYNDKNELLEIREINAKETKYEDTSYEFHKKIYEQKLKSVEKINSCINPEYEIDMFSVPNSILYKSSHSFEKNYFIEQSKYDEFFLNLQIILKDMSFSICIEYSDVYIKISENEIIVDNITLKQYIDRYNVKKDIEDIMKNNKIEKYNIESVSDALVRIEINEKFKKTYKKEKDKYLKLFNELLNVFSKYENYFYNEYVSIEIKFDDKMYIYINKQNIEVYNGRKRVNIEDYIK